MGSRERNHSSKWRNVGRRHWSVIEFREMLKNSYIDLRIIERWVLDEVYCSQLLTNIL
jgi:hypothetical protein